ncbi:MAG TPA: crosslink repair DNA glycosylase YcaQ family protein [Actinomycetota bacterium]
MTDFSAREARLVALAAQGLGRPRPRGRIDRRHVRGVLDRLHLLQIDSVNVLARAHYLPLFSRLGAYPMELLDTMTYHDRELFEYWGHEASLLPMRMLPLLRWRMEKDPHPYFERWVRQNEGLVEEVLDHVRAHGPMRISQLRDPGDSRGSWWGWSRGKTAMEYLFLRGRVTTAFRRGFERVYDLPERVFPAAALAQPAPSADDARRALLLLAADALGIGTAADLADYFRIHGATARRHVTELVEAGELTPVRVEGWAQPAYVRPGVRVPRAVRGRALLVPFDPMVFERKRTERLFGFHYRIEIYVPKPKRVYGYYVLPFLLGDELVARIDLKADRKAGALLVQGAFVEDGGTLSAIASELAVELREMADWLGLDRIKVGRRGALARPLARELGA